MQNHADKLNSTSLKHQYKILFLNTNGRFLKHCRLDGQVKEIKLYGNGSMAALVFRDRIEIIKL